MGRATTAKSEVEKIYTDVSMPVYEASYFPPQITKLAHERVQDIKAPASMPDSPRRWEVKWGGSTNYIRTYLNGEVSDFQVTQTKLYQPISLGEFVKNDLDALYQIQQEEQNPKIYYSGKSNYQNIERLNVGSSPTIFFLEYNKPILYVYKENIRIEIDGAGKVPKEELIKFAESLRKVK